MVNDKDFGTEKLSDDELDVVTGGTSYSQLMQIQCTCGTINMVDITKSNYVCKKCKKVNRIDG